MELCAPCFVTESAPIKFANFTLLANSSPLERAYASPELKASPAPVVSTVFTLKEV